MGNDMVWNNFWFLLFVGIAISLYIAQGVQQMKRADRECKNGNHVHEIRTSKWLIKPYELEKYTGEKHNSFSYGCAAYKLRKERTVCRHCHMELAVKWIRIGEYNSVSMGSDQMDEFTEDGIVRWE